MERKLRVAFDIDGVISTNPHFFETLTYFLTKKNNENEVFILTARNPSRYDDTVEELKRWNISYKELCFMPDDFARDFKTQGNWKKDTVSRLNIDLWFDNDFKWYEKECGIDFSDLKCKRIEI